MTNWDGACPFSSFLSLSRFASVELEREIAGLKNTEGMSHSRPVHPQWHGDAGALEPRCACAPKLRESRVNKVSQIGYSSRENRPSCMLTIIIPPSIYKQRRRDTNFSPSFVFFVEGLPSWWWRWCFWRSFSSHHHAGSSKVGIPGSRARRNQV